MPTARKEVANTLLEVLDDKNMQIIRDRSHDVIPAMNNVIEHWSFDLQAKRPGIANRNVAGTDVKFTKLDLATFLYSLAGRGAVINLPEYKAKRKTVLKEGETLISKGNRHGAIVGLTSNQNVFTFGIRIKDHNVIVEKEDGSQDLGAFRTFLMTDFNGDWYDGWKTVQFIPSAAENKWLLENYFGPDGGNRIYFDNFVTPEKWLSFYGKHYLMNKALESRLSEEIKHLNSDIKGLLETGITYPAESEYQVTDWPKQSAGEYDKQKVWAFEAQIDLPEPDYETEYPGCDETQEALVEATDKRQKLKKGLSTVRFINRSVELAFAKKHPPVNKEQKVSYPNVHWIKNAEWEEYKPEGKRTIWNRLKIFQPGVGKLSVALRYRWYQKTEHVAKETNEGMRRL